jgi:hypothetical protein
MCTAYNYIMHSIFQPRHIPTHWMVVLWDVQMGDNLIRIDSFFPDHPTDELLTWLSGYNVKLDTDSILVSV